MLHYLRSVIFILVIFVVHSGAIAQNENALPQPLTDEAFKALIQSSDTADWAKIRVLTDAQAKMAAEAKGAICQIGALYEVANGVWLPSVSILTDKQMALLAASTGFLYLDGLRSLPDKQFKTLSRYRGTYGRQWQIQQSAKRGRTIETTGGLICFNGLDSLTESQAKSLSNFSTCELQLNGITSISEKQAANISCFRGAIIQLSRLKTLSESQARSLAMFAGRILFRALDAQSIELFKKHGGNVFGGK